MSRALPRAAVLKVSRVMVIQRIKFWLHHFDMKPPCSLWQRRTTKELPRTLLHSTKWSTLAPWLHFTSRMLGYRVYVQEEKVNQILGHLCNVCHSVQ
jgi:hypothetical protein